MTPHAPGSRSPWRGAPPFVSALLVAATAAAAVAQTQTAAKLNPSVYPAQELFREIQLAVMACGRDNSAQSCDKARTMADPLMDHPQLSGSCKDVVWSVLETSVVAPKNSYERREALNRNATLLTVRCKKATKPLGGGSETSKEEPKKSGGLGGLLRSLGIGGGKSD